MYADVLRKLANQRILVLDGAMGTRLQQYGLEEEDFRGLYFKNSKVTLKGVYDVLSLTQPDLITEVHRAYLDAGADLIETNTFNASSVSMKDYQLQDFCWNMNFKAAQLARNVADEYTRNNPSKPRLVLGSVGPTNKICSPLSSSDFPFIYQVSYAELFQAYSEQIEALLRGGVDAILIETIYNLFNAQVAVEAAEKKKIELGIEAPVMLSATLSKEGRFASGESLEQFVELAKAYGAFSVGLNCCMGAYEMKPFLLQLSRLAPTFYISVHPNAGLPDAKGNYIQTPESMVRIIEEFIDERSVNIVGGCCGTTEDYIRLLNQLVVAKIPREVSL